MLISPNKFVEVAYFQFISTETSPGGGLPWLLPPSNCIALTAVTQLPVSPVGLHVFLAASPHLSFPPVASEVGLGCRNISHSRVPWSDPFEGQYQMSFRGRGRGRGGRGFGGAFEQRFAKHEPYILFPEDVDLPDISNVSGLKKEYIPLISRKLKLENFWKGSCYHLEDSANKSNAINTFIERYSSKMQQKNQAKREALHSYLKLIPSNFPAELIQGSRFIRHDQKKLRWDRDPDEKLFEKFEKLEENTEGDEKGEKKKDEMEEEEDDHLDEQDEESSDDGDYNQNVDFDDDEDDLNMEEEEYEDAYE